MPQQEHSIPVMFDVTAPSYEAAAQHLSNVMAGTGFGLLPDMRARGNDTHRIESWWFPEARLKPIDRNDNGAYHLVVDEYGGDLDDALAKVKDTASDDDDDELQALRDALDVALTALNVDMHLAFCLRGHGNTECCDGCGLPVTHLGLCAPK